jgi:hypothetical protein
MKIIRHRRNTIAELRDTPINLGIEVDIRSCGENLIIHHDPFLKGESFEEWIASYRHGLLILNVKEEGLEDRLLDLMNKHSIVDFFFLDQSFPFIVKTTKGGEHRSAIRVSEFESIETALSLCGKVQWVWVDFFTRFPLDHEMFHRLKSAGFSICLVSPELQGYDEACIAALQKILKHERIAPDAVCTKQPGLWL